MTDRDERLIEAFADYAKELIAKRERQIAIVDTLIKEYKYDQ